MDDMDDMEEERDVREQSSHSIPCLATIKEQTQSQPIQPVKFYSAEFHPTEPLLTAGSSDGKVRLFRYSPDNPSSLSCVARLDGRYNPRCAVTSVSFHPSGSLLLSCDNFDNHAKLWKMTSDYSSAVCVETMTGYDNRATSVLFHPNPDIPVFATRAGDKLKIWELPDVTDDSPVKSKCLTTLKNRQHFSSMSFDKMQNPPVIAASLDGVSPVLYRLSPDFKDKTEALLKQTSHNMRIERVVCHPSEPLMATSGIDKLTAIWKIEDDLESSRVVGSIYTDEKVTSLAFHPTASPPLLALGCADNSIQFWRMTKDGTRNNRLAKIRVDRLRMGPIQAQVPVISLAFHPTELLLASISEDGTFKLWDCQMLSQRRQFKNIKRSMGELTSTVVRRLRNKDRPHTLNSAIESRAILNRVASEMLRRIPNSDFFREINARLTAIESMLSHTHPSRASRNAAVVQYVRRTPLYRTMKAKQLKQLKDKSERSSPKTDEDDSSSGSDGGGSKRLRHTRRRPVSRVRRSRRSKSKSKTHKRMKYSKTKK
jgi:WD40 repeat protein